MSILEFNDGSGQTQILALHYARQLGDEELILFLSGQLGIDSPELATRMVEGFWQMTDLAVDDHHQGNTVAGVEDIESWMHKLFIKVHGYMIKHGFEAEWNAASDRY